MRSSMWPLARLASRMCPRTAGAQSGRAAARRLGSAAEVRLAGGGGARVTPLSSPAVRLLRESALVRGGATGSAHRRAGQGGGSSVGAIAAGRGKVDVSDDDGGRAGDGDDDTDDDDDDLDDDDDDDDDGEVWPGAAKGLTQVVDFDSFDPEVLHIMPLGGCGRALVL